MMQITSGFRARFGVLLFLQSASSSPSSSSHGPKRSRQGPNPRGFPQRAAKARRAQSSSIPRWEEPAQSIRKRRARTSPEEAPSARRPEETPSTRPKPSARPPAARVAERGLLATGRRPPAVAAELGPPGELWPPAQLRPSSRGASATEPGPPATGRRPPAAAAELGPPGEPGPTVELGPSSSGARATEPGPPVTGRRPPAVVAELGPPVATWRRRHHESRGMSTEGGGTRGASLCVIGRLRDHRL